MGLYKELAGLRCFTRGDLIKITGSESATAWHISSFLKKGYIERINESLEEIDAGTEAVEGHEFFFFMREKYGK